jgi:ribose 5-phosphate isomerase A
MQLKNHVNKNYILTLKKKVSLKALEIISDTEIIAIGSGSTVNEFIKILAESKKKISVICASISSENLAIELGLNVLPFNIPLEVEYYVDGADEVDSQKNMIKGGGGALTREKTLSQFSRKFMCIVDESKKVENFGKFPIPVEISEPFLRYGIEYIKKMGGIAKTRDDFKTDNGNLIIDCSNLDFSNIEILESRLNSIPGALTNGIFSIRKANYVLIGKKDKVELM